jgi:tRNA uridine 5-carbamoylmethylation protein Kti12
VHLACLIILRGPQCSGKTEVSQRLRETLDEKHKKRTYLLKLNEINIERFKKALNEASTAMAGWNYTGYP